MKMKKLLVFMLYGITLYSCKKTESIQDAPTKPVEAPMVRKDRFFPNGVLQFNSKESVNSFYESVNTKPGFISSQHLDNFYSLKSSLKKFDQGVLLRENEQDIPEVDSAEFIYDSNINLVDDDGMQDILNSDLQVIIDSKLYQLTNIGFFTVNLDNLSDFLALMDQQKQKILFDPTYKSIPGETSIGDGKYQVIEGVERKEPDPENILPPPIPPCDPTTDPDCPGFPGGGGGGGGTGGGGGGGTPCGQLPANFQYELHTVGPDFQSSNTIFFDDRCYTFKTQNINFLGMIHLIDIKGKLQRKKKFMWWYYWGPSYADENIVGCDNGDVESDYVFVHPEQYSTLTRPAFTHAANFSIGNNTLHTVGINVNINALFYTLTNAEVTSFINKKYNKIVNGLYTDGFRIISDKLISSIDPSYLTQYEAYTKMVQSLDDQYKLKFILGQGERYQGYSHENHWTFDWHVGFGTGNNVHYTVKAGSFYGRLRVGCTWYGIRTVVVP